MRFLSVRADAFGPFTPGSELRFEPGLNVIYGRNEAGKSSWHAAIYAGLCGMRRGQGRPSADDQMFIEKHRPWDAELGGRWAASTTIELSDGKRLELRHDLMNKTAVLLDAVTGAGVQMDIVRDGAPDGSRLLGLDRRAFLATACVRHTGLTPVGESSEYLQEYLQKAVATGRDDATVVTALGTLERFFDSQIGSDRATSKPWRQTNDDIQRFRTELGQARAAHEAHLELIASRDVAQAQADGALYRVKLAEASQMRLTADDLRSRVARAEELSRSFPQGAPPAVSAEEELANEVAVALSTWDNQPEARSLIGASAAQLQDEMVGLADASGGDLMVHPTVRVAVAELQNSQMALQQHASMEPAGLPEPDTHGLTEDELRQLSFDLRGGIARGGREKSLQDLLVLGGGALAMAGLVVALMGYLAGVALVVGGGAAVLWGLRVGKREADGAGLGLEVRTTAEARAAEAGLAPEPAALEAIANALAAARTRQAERAAWFQHRGELGNTHARAEESVRAALWARGVTPDQDIHLAVRDYESACTERGRSAAEVDRLKVMIESRLEAERAAFEVEAVRERALHSVVVTARKCGSGAEDGAIAVEALREWLGAHRGKLAELDATNSQWTELNQMFGPGGTMAGLREAAMQAETRASALSEGLSPTEVASFVWRSDAESQIAELRNEHAALAERASQLQGRVNTETARLPSVTLAEEELAGAEAELLRLTRSRETLERTRQFLEVAQDRVNHDIAPVLSQLISDRLGGVTDGRYSDVRVDPQDLTVRVRLADGTLQPAHVLSHGTAEQVYLLLRVAMAERLSKPGEVCPLILDDVTVQSDRVRTHAILVTLLTLSRERQVILFSQEDEVLEWARAALAELPGNQLIELNG